VDTESRPSKTLPATDIRYIGRLVGCYLLASRRNDANAVQIFACRTSSISPHTVVVEAPVIGNVGEDVTMRFDPLGLLRGKISHTTPGGFALALHCTKEERIKLASRLLWVKKHASHRAPDQRKHKRVLPRHPHAHIFWPEKGLRDCLIIDMSQSGVGVSADINPPLGALVAVGKVMGLVVRHLENGFAVAFSHRHEMGGLEEKLTHDLKDKKDLATTYAEVLYTDLEH
jgi:hypothetical protein